MLQRKRHACASASFTGTPPGQTSKRIVYFGVHTLPFFINTHVLIIVGRLLLGGLFVLGGLTHFFVLRLMTRQMAERGIPLPGPMLIAGSVFQAIAGLAVMAGWVVPLAAGSLIAFTVVSSCMMMNFWDMSGEKRLSAIDGWTSNLGVIGGLLVLAGLS